MTSKTHEEPLLQEEKKEMEPEILTAEQVNACLEKIENAHPLKEAQIKSVYPFLQRMSCFNKQKKNFKLGLRYALLEQMDIKMPESDEDVIANPYLLLGYGFNAYFDVIRDLVYYFFFTSIFVMPLFMIYGKGDALADYTYAGLAEMTMGNIYGSSIQCIQSPMSLDKLTLSCPAGKINSQLMYDNLQDLIGIIPSDASFGAYCTNTALLTDSYFDDSTAIDCTDLLDTSSLMQEIIDNCDLQTDCEIDSLSSYLTNTLNAPSGWSDECTSANALFFAQVPCYYDSEEITYAKTVGLFISALTVFVSLFTMLNTDYIRSKQRNDFVEFDVNTITAGDYSIEFDIEDEVYKSFLTQVYHNDEEEFSKAKFGHTPNIAFREWIKKLFEDRISDLPDLGYEDEEQERINISICTLAFENGNLIDLLKKRGNAIKLEKYDEMRQFDDQIDDLKNTEEKYDKLTFPCSVFFTFENEEGYNRACQYHETVEADDKYASYRTLFGVDFELQEASEPTDILWENRQYTPQERTKRMAITITVVLISLFASFIVVTILSDFAYQKKLQFGQPVCGTMYLNFGFSEDDLYTMSTSDFTTMTSDLNDQATREYDQYEASGQTNTTYFQSGYTNCYCNAASDVGATLDDKCNMYFEDYYIALAVSSSISFVLVIVNSILQTITISYIEWVAHDTQSEQMTNITNWVFVAQFFNTAFVPLLVFANFSEQSQFLGSLFNSYYYDYSPLWFDNVGYLMVYTMGLNMVMAPMMMPVGWMMQWFFRKMDRSWTNDIYKTKQTSMQGYIDLYSGPGYIIHFKYSGVLNIVFVTMFYGIGMPVLFPIALFSLIFIWFCERYEIAYNYQLPPSLDDKLTKNTVKILRWAPVLLLLNAYWMISNKQYFGNNTTFVNYSYDQMLSDHIWDDVSVDQSSPTLFAFIFITVIVIGQLYFNPQLKKIGFVMSSNKIEVDEDLPAFFTSLKLQWCDWMVNEYNHYLNEYGVEIANKDIIDTLDDTGVPTKTLQGIPFYTILANPDYAKKFYYIDTSQPCREAQIKDDDDNEDNDLEQSDLVVLLLNLGCIPQKAAIQKFEPGFNITFKKYMRDNGLLKANKDDETAIN